MSSNHAPVALQISYIAHYFKPGFSESLQIAFGSVSLDRTLLFQYNMEQIN